MHIEKEEVAKHILNVIDKANEPLETKEIEGLLKNTTRAIILYRLNYLRADGLIKGKQVGSAKGTWIWWKNGDKGENRKI